MLLVAAAEWRAEIAVRRRGDPALKAAAVAYVLGRLRRSRLWSVFEDGWAEPERYSLILQPFLVSPIINVQDVLCAAHLHPAAAAGAGAAAAPADVLDAALRAAHPFPILERWVDADVIVGGRVRVRAGTQCIIFTADLRGSTAWPVFGAGPRVCAGAHLARALLRAFLAELPAAPGGYFPLHGHRHSGRHNDGVANVQEAVYFCKTVVRAIFTK